MRVVDLDAVIDCIEVEWGYEGIREDLYSLPVIDAVPVVRCKDCKYFVRELENGKHDCIDLNLPYCRPDDFCSYGVQKEATSTDE